MNNIKLSDLPKESRDRFNRTAAFCEETIKAIQGHSENWDTHMDSRTKTLAEEAGLITTDGTEGFAQLARVHAGEYAKKLAQARWDIHKLCELSGIRDNELRVISLHYVKGLAYIKVAQRMKCAINTVFRYRRLALYKMSLVFDDYIQSK